MTSPAPAIHSRQHLPIKMLRPAALFVVVALTASSCAYFNTFYNAQNYYRQGVASLEAAGLNSLDDLLPDATRSAFEKAIEKSHKVIDEYSGSKYVAESIYIIARSRYYLGDLGLAERYLRQVLDGSPGTRRAGQVRL